MIVIINYGMGNLGSMHNMLKKIGTEHCISSDKTIIEKADKIILPGVGAFDHAMQSLNQMNLIPLLNELVLEHNIPILGVCLGMQLLSKSSEEGILKGLELIDAKTIKFYLQERSSLKIPHMGWNSITVKRDNPLLSALNNESRFYFVHSYHVQCMDESDVLATARYSIEFTAILAHKNIYGAQFHPEKSHRFGMQLLKNFSLL